MKRKSTILWAVITGILVSSACVVTIPVPGSVPTTVPVAPVSFETDAFQPQDIAPTVTPGFTETSLPTWTAVFTPTFFPSITPLPTRTLTPSITPTPPAIETLGPDTPPETLTAVAGSPVASGDPIGSTYSCILIGKKFADLSVFKPKYQFTMWWELQNAGQKSWEADGVVISLIEGKKLSKDRTAQLPFDVSPNQKVQAKVNMETPKEPGTYSMTWGLKTVNSNRHFCFFTFTLVVKK